MVRSALIFGLTMLGSLAHAQKFEHDKYLQKCGGKIYSKCDSAELNQETIFEEARAHALKNRLDIMLVIGADWCPACNIFAKMIASDPNSSKLHDKYAVVKINGDAKSAKTLSQKLNLTYVGFPQAFIFKADGKEHTQQLFPSRYSDVMSLLAELEQPQAAKIYQKPEWVGNTQATSLEKPIALTNDYGATTFIENPKTIAEKYINQGVAALHVYHYLDAFRSFKEAEKNDPTLVMAYVGQVLSALKMAPYDAGHYYANEALQKVEEIAQRNPLSKKDSAWFEFAKSYQVIHFDNYVKQAGVKIKSLQAAYNDLITHDRTNVDGQSLVVWLAMPIFTTSEIKEVYKSILKKQPRNIGAHHALLHLAEMENDEKNATHHAETLASLAPHSAHAIHMHAHTLPQKGKWSEALVLFKKADEIHQNWAAKNGLDADEDWHYSHNLDLMAATYLGLGDLNNAKNTWMKAFSDGRAVVHYLALTLLTSDLFQVDAVYNKFEVNGWGEITRPLRIELVLSPNNVDSIIVQLAKEKDSTYNKLLKKLLIAYSEKKQDLKVAKEINSYLVEGFKAGGFDGWSNAYLELLRFKRVAKVLSMDWVISELETVEIGVRNGSLCTSSMKSQSLTPCLK